MAKHTGHTITSDSALGSAVIQRSLRFNSADSAVLSRTITQTSNRKTFTHSFWIKRTTLGGQIIFGNDDSAGSYFFNFRFNSDHKIEFNEYRYNESPSNKIRLITTRVFRDITSWYHIVTAVDTTQGTAANRVKIYVNGVQETAFDTEIYCDQNHDTYFNATSPYPVIRIGSAGWGGAMNCYLAEFNAVDGYAYDPSYFGFTDSQTGLWMPKRYEGTYGTNGYRLDFSDNSSTAALGIDKSPNGNDFTANNFSVSAGTGNDSVLDTPSNNFCTLNPLDVYGDGIAETITQGNLMAQNTSGSYRTTRSTFYLKTGKWYWEVLVYDWGGGSGEFLCGVVGKDYVAGSGARRAYSSNGQKYIGSGSSYGATYTTDDVIGVALDLDNGTITFYKNGASQGVAFTDMLTAMVNGGWTPMFNGYSNSYAAMNFGQQPFTYTPPTGYKTLNSANLPPNVPSIIRPQKHFDCIIYTGNGSNGNKITGLEFKPDLVWFKCRSTTHYHDLYDSVRGANKRLIPNSTSAENSYSNLVQSFNEDGVTLGTAQEMNQNSATYVAWCWKAGGAAVTNNDGSGTSQVSANQEAGFSIVTYTGNATGSFISGAWQTIGHGLGKTPKWIVFKSRSFGDADTHWANYHVGVTDANTDYVVWDTTEARIETDVNYMGSTLPTSSVFSLGYNFTTNKNGEDYVAYCWAEIPGYSKFGSYTGNGNSDGTYVHLGFRPAWLMVKKTSGTDSWLIMDNKRDIDNVVSNTLAANSSGTENADTGGIPTDFLSNGFKCRGSGGDFNGDGSTYIYMAFAEEPGTTPFDTFPNAR